MAPHVLGVPIPSSAVAIGLGTAVTAAASYAIYKHVVQGGAKFEKSGKVSFRRLKYLELYISPILPVCT